MLGEVANEDVTFTLLPNTPHSITINLSQTLVVHDTPLFKLLVGNTQTHPVADALTRYPVPQLHLLPQRARGPELLRQHPHATWANAHQRPGPTPRPQPQARRVHHGHLTAPTITR
jgi:hypothetical protein